MCMGMGMCMGIGMGMGMGMSMGMCMGMGMRMRVSKGKSCMIRYSPWWVNPFITLKFKSLLYSLSMCSHCMRKANSS